jgi:hypothetical protein
MMCNIQDDIPKHRKKKGSSTSKSKEKSKHKHEYVECLLIERENNKPHRATYCKICGKIGDIKVFETEKTEKGYYRTLSSDEVFEKYKDLEKIYIEDLWQKYVPIGKEEEK